MAVSSAGNIGRVRLTMPTPAALQTITTRFRLWGYFPGNYIVNCDDENNGCNESDDNMATDDSSGAGVGG